MKVKYIIATNPKPLDMLSGVIIKFEYATNAANKVNLSDWHRVMLSFSEN